MKKEKGVRREYLSFSHLLPLPVCQIMLTVGKAIFPIRKAILTVRKGMFPILQAILTVT